MRRVVEAARADLLVDEDIAELAEVLAASGLRLARLEHSADVASTGGPSSLSTLLCPLMLRLRGLLVAKLGVPGRPAGGVDILRTIPGFRAVMDLDHATDALRRFGYIHLQADDRWAPLDAELFVYRQRTYAQTIPALVIASILSKKLAAGVLGAGLEIRVAPHGNFGGDPEEARVNARRYNAVASLLDLRPVCVLTDARRPYQPYMGRGEALLALSDVLAGHADRWLADHLRLCRRIADAVANVMGADLTTASDTTDLRVAQQQLLHAHSTDMSAFEQRVEEIRTAHRTVIRADQPGVVAYDVERLRELLVACQRTVRAEDQGAPPDPAGVVLGAPAGTRLEAGEIVMSIRVPDGNDQLASRLASCATIDPTAGDDDSGGSTLEVI